MKKLDENQWSSFWDYQTVTSLDSIFTENYDGEVAEFWRDVLLNVPKSVLDLACGNGAITWLANDILNCQSNHSKITGVDFANVDPFSNLGKLSADYPMIEFLPNTPVEKLPFDDNSFDVAISQYGLEYSNLELSIPEMARTLKPRSRIGLIVHGEESVVVRGAVQNIDRYRYILEKIKLHDLYLELNAIAGKKKDLSQALATKKAQRKLQEIQHAADEINSLMGSGKAQAELMLYRSRLADVFSGKVKPVNRASRVRKVVGEFEDFLNRIEDLKNASLLKVEQAQLVSLLEQSGYRICIERPMKYAQFDNIGVAILAERGQ